MNKLSDIAPASDIRKASSGLLDPNKSQHLAKLRLAERKKAKEASTVKPVKAVKEGVHRSSLPIPEPAKRISVMDFIKTHL